MRLMRLLLVLCVIPGVAYAGQTPVKDPSGKTLAVIVDCSSCPAGKTGATCRGGVMEGFHDGAACGQCLLDANFGFRIGYAHDLHIVGLVNDENGKPVKSKFVKLYLPNTWTVRTRTGDDGRFRVMLGATIQPAGKLVAVDVGTVTLPSGGDANEYSLLMLPEQYKPCKKEK